MARGTDILFPGEELFGLSWIADPVTAAHLEAEPATYARAVAEVLESVAMYARRLEAADDLSGLRGAPPPSCAVQGEAAISSVFLMDICNFDRVGQGLVFAGVWHAQIAHDEGARRAEATDAHG